MRGLRVHPAQSCAPGESISSLGQIGRGRIEVGFGTGGKRRAFAAFGVDPERYVARFYEGVEVMTRLWRDSRVDFSGEFWQLADATMEPKPFQKPYPPLWFGGQGRILFTPPSKASSPGR
jgi:alkanesulfonate monooxygenase SsuD/methylene tetrahydromethanopterin reductase-like flavin-dependent oxidoreductase (luciferase family)